MANINLSEGLEKFPLESHRISLPKFKEMSSMKIVPHKTPVNIVKLILQRLFHTIDA